MWGYHGWGNYTAQLVKAVDAVELEQGFKPPVFVDVRIRRQARAAGFQGGAFQRLLGDTRYKWMEDLGNENIITREEGIRIRRSEAASDLLDFAMTVAAQGRRLIFFCQCEYPCNCHRYVVGSLVLKYAQQRKQPVQVVEWPGGNPKTVKVQVAEEVFR